MDEISGGDPSPVRVNKLGHLVYEVSDVEKTVKFWTEVMGFSLSDRNHLGMAFLRCGSDHHAIALAQSKTPGSGCSIWPWRWTMPICCSLPAIG
jgi:hypothetical protein